MLVLTSWQFLACRLSRQFLSIKSRARLLLPGLALLLASCAAQRIEMQQQSLAQMPGKKLALVSYEPHGFVDFTPGNAVFGVIGALAAQGQGDSLVKQYQLKDPAGQMAALLAQRLAQERGMVLLAPSEVPLTSEDINALIATRPGADYILDIKTTGWATMYYAADWTHYKVSYSARLRLIDARSKLVLAQQACYSVQKDNEPEPPSKDDLLAHDATLLKQRIVLGAADCMNGFASNALKLAATSQQAYMLPPDAAGQLDTQAQLDLGAEELAAAAMQDPQRLVDARWSARMSCGPSSAANARQPNNPSTMRYDVDVSRYPVIRLHRRSTAINETLAAKVVNGRMLMRGTGYRVENPAVRWSVRLDGAFNGAGTVWEGSGGIFMRNTQNRSCTMSLKKA